MNFFAYMSSGAQRVVYEDHAGKRGYRNFIQVALERFEFRPKSVRCSRSVSGRRDDKLCGGHPSFVVLPKYL
jgi:hypothetical protein